MAISADVSSQNVILMPVSIGSTLLTRFEYISSMPASVCIPSWIPASFNAWMNAASVALRRLSFVLPPTVSGWVMSTLALFLTFSVLCFSVILVVAILYLLI